MNEQILTPHSRNFVDRAYARLSQVNLAYRLRHKAARLIYLTIGHELDDLRRQLAENPYREEHHRTQSIYIHVPKTGGNSVTQMIYGVPSMSIIGHATARTFLKYSPALYSRYFVFATVRHPFERLRSAFYFLKAGGMEEEDRKWSTKNLAEYDTFRQFVFSLERKDICRRVLAYTHFIPQSDFVCNEDGELIVDHLVRLESFDVGMRKVCRKLNIVYDMKRENATVKLDLFDEECLDELKQRCFALYENDYKVLHYDQMDIG